MEQDRLFHKSKHSSLIDLSEFRKQILQEIRWTQLNCFVFDEYWNAKVKRTLDTDSSTFTLKRSTSTSITEVLTIQVKCKAAKNPAKITFMYENFTPINQTSLRIMAVLGQLYVILAKNKRKE